ncbi:MAG: gliding motility-associated C-terminal domain-containing protein [Flavobacteriales bacterium]|nr:gliding motility-associated C-terminal domain-containing protein [Flavobacteriales bacterium]
MNWRSIPPRVLLCRALAVALLLILSGQLRTSAQNDRIATRGKRFQTGFIQNSFGANSLKVHVMSTVATSGTVSIPLAGWSTSFTVAANNVAVVDVPTSAENWGSGTVAQKGVLIETNDSVNVFISSFQNFTHDLSQILPESSLGNSYRVDAYHGIPNSSNLHKSELLVVATQDGTQIRIVPSCNVLGGGAAGVPMIVNMNAGETYQLQAATDALDLTGTTVDATSQSGSFRPFAVYGGSMCATIPGACQACDAIFEQLLPKPVWGTRYLTVPVAGVNSTTYRILADENGTNVTIAGGAPIVLNAGQTHEVNGTNTPVCIQSTRPISVTQFLEGIGCAGNGDPAMMLLSPATDLSTRASFHTPTSGLLNQHSISVVMPASALGQLTLDGIPVSPALFQPYAACSDRIHAKIPVTQGVHRLAAAGGFQAYMFGLGSGESYACSVGDIGVVPVQQDSVVCGTGPITLNAPEPLSNATWTEAGSPAVVLATGNSYSFTPTGSGSYTVNGTQPITGCPRSFTYHVGIPLTIPTLVTANDGPTAAVCQYQSVQLGLQPPPDPAWFQIQWSPASSLSDPNIPDPVAIPLSDTWYTVAVTSPSGCGNMLDSVFIDVTPGAVLEMTTTSEHAELCLGDSTQLSSTTLRVLGSDRFNGPIGPMWTAVQGGVIGAQCGSLSGTALYFNGNGQRYVQTIGYNTTGGGFVRFHLKIANGSAPCDDADPGEDVVLEYSLNNGLNWSTMATFSENMYPAFQLVSTPIPSPAQGTNTMFRIRQLANSGAGQDNWAIDDVVISRYDDSWLNYSWSPATVTTVTSPNTMGHPTTSGWYTLNGTDPTAGCVYRDSVHVQVNPAFSIQLTPDTTLCAVEGIQLNATPGSGSGIQYAWSPNNGTLSSTTIADPIATPTTTTTYTALATTAAGCTAQGSVTITVGQLLALSLSASQDTLCQGQSSQLNAAAGGANGLSYQWSGAGLNATNIAAPIASPAQTTTYTCTVTHAASGCSLSADITITVNTGYTANAGPDVTVCSALGHQLTVQHNVADPSYTWSPAAGLNSATIQSPTILTDATQTFTVTITDPNGCSVSDDVTITRAFAGLPTQTAVSACADAPPTLTAPATGVSYQWNTPTGNGPATPSMVASSSGAHAVTITDAQGCQGTSVFSVTLYALPVVSLGPDLSLCGATAQVLNAGNPGSSYAWSTGATTGTISVNASGTYGVTVTNSQQCSASDSMDISFNTLPADVLQDVQTCVSTPPTLDAGNAGATYLWNTGAQTQTISPSNSGTYSVLVTTPQGCSATFDAVVDLAPAITVALGNDTSICAGTMLDLDAGSPGATYQWSTGATTRNISVTTSGTYSVTVNNGGCSASDAITIQVIEAPTDALNDITSCIDDPVSLDAGNPGCAFLWNTGQTEQVIQIPSSGNYSVLVTNATGCAATFSAHVEYVTPPVVDLGPDTVLCEGQVRVLDAGNPGATYAWSNGSNARTINVSQAGTYQVLVDNGHCQQSDSATILFNPSPVRMATRQFHTCLEEEPRYVVLDAGNAGSRYEWSDGATTQVILAGAYGWYFVNVTNVYDCATRDSVVVNEYCPSTIFVPNTFTPNGDGLNDVFIPVGKNIGSMHLFIFDRWGELIFESDDPEMGWDGTYRGEVVKNDMYMWRLNYKFEDKDGTLGMEQKQMGHIQVLR